MTSSLTPTNNNPFDAVGDQEAAAGMKEVLDAAGTPLQYMQEGRDRPAWYLWNGACHERLPDGQAYLRVFKLWREINAQGVRDQQGSATALARALKDDKDGTAPGHDELKTFKERVLYANKLRNNAGMVSFEAAIARDVRIPPDHFTGNDRQWVAFKDGQVLDLAKFKVTKRVELEAPDPARRIYRVLGANYVPDAPRDRWQTFLDSSLPDVTLQKYLQDCAGAALLGEAAVKRIPHLVGEKDTGKSTYLKAMVAVFGGYGGTVSGFALQKQQGQNFERDKFRGLRFASISEPQRAEIDDAFLLSVTGGEPIMSGGKGKDFDEWTPECIVHIAANKFIQVDTRAREVSTRVDKVDFDHTQERKSYGTRTFDQYLQEQAEGILAWAVEGALSYVRQGGVPLPGRILAGQEKNATDSSHVRSWLAQKIKEGQYEISESVVSGRRCMKLSVMHGHYRTDTLLAEERVRGKTLFKADVLAHLGHEDTYDSAGQRFSTLVPGPRYQVPVENEGDDLEAPPVPAQTLEPDVE